jgi:hypothetical protein
MSDNIKETNIEEKKKVDEVELQAWLDAVHFGSCCSDPLSCEETEKNETNLKQKKIMSRKNYTK